MDKHALIKSIPDEKEEKKHYIKANKSISVSEVFDGLALKRGKGLSVWYHREWCWTGVTTPVSVWYRP